MSLITTFPLDSRGHNVWPTEVKAYRWNIKDDEPGEDAPWVPMEIHTCGLCGEFVRLDIQDGKAVAKNQCSAPNGITTATVIDVPSGKIIVGDDFRPVFGPSLDDEEGFLSYNSKLGQAQVVEFYESQGCAYGPVGNTSPNLYRTGKDTYAIANVPWHDETTANCQDRGHPLDEDGECTLEEVAPNGWESLANICTDLWAYSVADYDLWLSRGGKPVEEMGWSYNVVEVPPGKYEFTLHTGELNFENHGEGLVVFADIRKLES